MLLSELMLQQTRVDTVIPYFERFVARWPTLEAFAAASEEAVVAAWAGLGYYSRARNLHRAARTAAALGGIPATVEELRALPGVGPYTAGAIASICFGVPAPAVDGNVERVIARLMALDEDPKSTSGKRAIADAVRALHEDGDAPSALTQGLMELGATVCSPRRPKCDVCPWTARCAARADGDVERWPRTTPKAPPKPARAVAGLLWDGPRALMGRRGPGLLAGMWEPILAEIPMETPEDALSGEVERAFLRRAGVRVRASGRLGDLVHVFTHRRLQVAVFAVVADGSGGIPDESYAEIAWVDPGERGDVGLSRLGEKMIDLALGAPPLLQWAAESVKAGDG